MMDLIRKRDIDYISAPIAPVLKGENVHYEYVAFRKQIEDISPVPAIPIRVIEDIKREITKSVKLHSKRPEISYDSAFADGLYGAIHIIDKVLEDYDG